MHHCSKCGKIGHRRPKCPDLQGEQVHQNEAEQVHQNEGEEGAQNEVHGEQSVVQNEQGSETAG